jgi:hypothetical protein
MEKFTKQQFADYVLGWLESSQHCADQLDMGNMKAALHNAKMTIDDIDDGIAAAVERKEYISNMGNSSKTRDEG